MGGGRGGRSEIAAEEEAAVEPGRGIEGATVRQRIKERKKVGWLPGVTS